MPSQGELQTYSNSNNSVLPYFLYRMGHDIFQEFNEGANKKLILSDPKNVILRDKMTAMSTLGNVIATGKITGFSWDIDKKRVKSNGSHILAEGWKHCGNKFTDYSGKTIGDSINKNQVNYPKMQGANLSMHEILATFRRDPNNNFNSFSNIQVLFNGSLNATNILNANENYLENVQVITDAQTIEARGTFEEREAKVDVAFKLTDKFLGEKAADTKQKTKNKIVNRFLNSDTFNSFATNKNPDEIKELAKNMDFFNSLVAEYANKQTEENKEEAKISMAHEIKNENSKDKGITI